MPCTAIGGDNEERNTSDNIPQGSRKAGNTYTSLLYAEIVNNNECERDPTPGSRFSARHELTQGSAFGLGHKRTQVDPPWDSAKRDYTAHMPA